MTGTTPKTPPSERTTTLASRPTPPFSFNPSHGGPTPTTASPRSPRQSNRSPPSPRTPTRTTSRPHARSSSIDLSPSSHLDPSRQFTASRPAGTPSRPNRSRVYHDGPDSPEEEEEDADDAWSDARNPSTILEMYSTSRRGGYDRVPPVPPRPSRASTHSTSRVRASSSGAASWFRAHVTNRPFRVRVSLGAVVFVVVAATMISTVVQTRRDEEKMLGKVIVGGTRGGGETVTGRGDEDGIRIGGMGRAGLVDDRGGPQAGPLRDIEFVSLHGDFDDVDDDDGPARKDSDRGQGPLGRDGDWVTTEDGSRFRYRNAFGGTFLRDDPDGSSSYRLSARAQQDSPSLGEEWDWEKDRIHGVNLGGWLTLEPFITPSMFEPFLNSTSPSPAVDEWTLSLNLRERGKRAWRAQRHKTKAARTAVKRSKVGKGSIDGDQADEEDDGIGALDEEEDDEGPETIESWIGGHEAGEEELRTELERHYQTFITERDFAEIAAAGLNWVRIPIPYWAIKRSDGEPFLEKVAWKYLLKALKWSRKYGLRVNLDLHSVPGSQNGWNHSGRLGTINWLHGVMGFANAQRSLDYVETLAEFVARDEVREVVQMFSILNEPMMGVIGIDPLRSFYARAYRLVRSITGYGKGRGPVLALHDGFKGTRRWFDFALSPSFQDFAYDRSLVPPETRAKEKWRMWTRMGGLDRVAIDSHRYLAFAEPDLRSVREQVLKPCQKWAGEFNKTFNGFGIPIAGEFSVAVNDCGRFLNNVNQGTRIEGTFLDEVTGEPLYGPSVKEGTCGFWEDYENWDETLKESLRDLAYAQMDTFQNWFYWT
ncbi:hypothetical protein JCM10212_001342 [Sporobolomyces blumeae]